MIYHKIGVSNAGPFLGDWEVELPEGPTVIMASYDNSDVKSNRGGKSYFAIDLPRYVLFGKFRVSNVDDFSHRLVRGKEDAFGELEVESSDSRIWKLKRGRTAGGNSIRELNESAISENDLKKIVKDEILGLNYEEYKNTNLFIQGKMHSFMEMGASDKRRLVSPWFKTDRWIPRADLAKTRLTKAQSELKKLDAREEVAKAALENRDERETAVKDMENNEKISRNVLENAMELKIAAKTKYEESDKNREQRINFDKQITDLEKKAEKELKEAQESSYKSTVTLLKSKQVVDDARERDKLIKSFKDNATLISSMRDGLNAIKENIRSAKSDYKKESKNRDELLNNYNKLKETRTGICPILLQDCDRIKSDPDILKLIIGDGLSAKRAMDRATSLEEDYRVAAENARTELKLKEDEEEELTELKNKTSYEEALREFDRCDIINSETTKKLKKCESNQSEYTDSINRINGYIAGIPFDDGMLKQNYDDAIEFENTKAIELDETSGQLANARALLAETNRATDELENIAIEREKVREKVRLLAWSSYAFGSAGIPSRELENAFGVAEDEMNNVLSELESPQRVYFSPTRELKDWEPACLACGETFQKGERKHICKVCGNKRKKRRRDELRLEVEDAGNRSSFDLDSGGGKVLLSIGARLGLSALPRACRAVFCEHLIIDEPDGALDDPNKAALHNLIQRKLGELGIRQVLLITHSDIRKEFQSVVMVHRWEDEDRSGVWID